MKSLQPQNIPVQAVWVEKNKEWAYGPTDNNREIGEWRWWRSDGSLSAHSSYNMEGLLDGIVKRYHPNGELSQWARYRKGKIFGRQILTKPTSGFSTENPNFPTSSHEVYRWDAVFLEGVMYNIHTFYNLEGLKKPISTNGDGYSINLGEQLYKILPDTSLVMVEDILQPISGRGIRVGKKSIVTYMGPADKSEKNYIIKLDTDRQVIVSAQEISQKLSLAVDRIDHNVAKKIELGVW